jgi:hypothetical protein
MARGSGEAGARQSASLFASRPGTTVSALNRKASQGIRCRLADNLARLRKARGYTQEELARICGFQKATSVTSSRVR